jgi:HEAT repeat protein
MTKVAPGLRRRIAGALAAAGTPSAETVAVDALLDKDPGVVNAAANSLSDKIPALSPAHRKALANHLLELLGNKKKDRLPVAAQAAVIRLLDHLDDSRAEPLLWERTQAVYPSFVRAAALRALGKWVKAPVKDKLQQIIACAADRDFAVAAPALMILKDTPVSGKTVPDWLPLLEAPDPAVRGMAIEKLGDQDTPKVAAALLKQLDQGDRGLRDEATARLARLKEGRKALAGALLEADSADRAWLLARAQAHLAADYPAELRDRIWKQAGDYLESDDRRADALLSVLREADARGLRDRLEEKALALRKKKQFAAALAYLRLLTRDPACSAAVRFEEAACSLKLSQQDLAHEARAADPALELFANLIHHFETDLPGLLEEAKWLEPEDLFYLGFHFAEKDHQEQKFGGVALKLLVQRSPRSKLAKDAKTKLSREGLD